MTNAKEVKPFLVALSGFCGIQITEFVDAIFLHQNNITFLIQSAIGIATLVYMIKKIRSKN